MRADRKVFDAIVSGEMNALAATLRGAVVIEGDLGLLARFQRLFPGRSVRSDGADPQVSEAVVMSDVVRSSTATRSS